jgi:hypothetical protein
VNHECTIVAMLVDAPSGLTTSLTPVMAFWWAAGVSLAIEISSLYGEIRAANAGGLPAYYKNPLFWFVRILVNRNRGSTCYRGRSGKAIARDQHWSFCASYPSVSYKTSGGNTGCSATDGQLN